MVEDHVDVLGDLHVLDGHVERHVREGLQCAAAVARQPDDFVALLFGVLRIDCSYRLPIIKDNCFDTQYCV